MFSSSAAILLVEDAMSVGEKPRARVLCCVVQCCRGADFAFTLISTLQSRSDPTIREGERETRGSSKKLSPIGRNSPDGGAI